MTSRFIMVKSEEDADVRQSGNNDRIRVRNRSLLSQHWARLEKVSFDYQRSDGAWQQLEREIYHRGHGAAILLYNLEYCTIVLTRQFRFPAWELGGNGFLLEVPAGIIEGNDPVATVQVETQQETGFLIERPSFLFKAFATPGSVTEQLYYYAATYDPGNKVSCGGGVVEEGEDIEVLEVPVEKAIMWSMDGTIEDAKTILLIQYAQLHLFSA